MRNSVRYRTESGVGEGAYAGSGREEIGGFNKVGKKTSGISSCPHSPISSGVAEKRLAGPPIRHIR